MGRGTERDLSGAAVPVALEKLEALGVRLERARDWIIAWALVGFIDQAEEGERLTLEGLADVDSGRLAAHKAVLAWADSLDTDTPVPLPLPCRGRECPRDGGGPPSLDATF
jgi:predicted transcriptional regulator